MCRFKKSQSGLLAPCPPGAERTVSQHWVPYVAAADTRCGRKEGAAGRSAPRLTNTTNERSPALLPRCASRSPSSEYLDDVSYAVNMMTVDRGS